MKTKETSIPFYYRILFKPSSYNDKAEISEPPCKIINEFKEPNPIDSRKRAFKEFDEYLEWLKQNERIKEEDDGNSFIIQPSSINELTRKEIKKAHSPEGKFAKLFKYEEKIELTLIFNSGNSSAHKFAVDRYEETGIFEKEIVIRKVSSFHIRKEELLDLLEYEFEIYKYFNLDTKDLN